MANLAEGDYVFKVRASNNLGAGEWSEPVYVSVLEGYHIQNPNQFLSSNLREVVYFQMVLFLIRTVRAKGRDGSKQGRKN